MAFGDRLYVLAKGLDDNKIYINSKRKDQPFDGWTEVQGGGRTNAALAAAAFGDRLYVLGKGLDDNIYINSGGKDERSTPTGCRAGSRRTRPRRRRPSVTVSTC